ncbi:hypothetical protein [uncultured Roseibium sp.]|uniref:hypothetical protein n=1 Tax=uncultured Roseibium sp. TaxID=1936171 RepID=UPI0026076CF8|nr:hypothetical protein [uncultured Roseibium sp.]
MTRDEMISLVKAETDETFIEELGHHLGIDDREYEYDELSALFDIEDRAEIWVKQRYKGAMKLLNVSRRLMIAIGFYVPMSAEDIERSLSWSSSGGTRDPWAFKMGGVAYELCDGWLEPFSPPKNRRVRCPKQSI